MDQIETLLTRAVDTIYPSKKTLEKTLKSGRKLRLYQGFDPTGTQLHIGHMTGLRKLAQFAACGHHVIFLIGDGTGQAGDPSGKLAQRDTFFNHQELRENAKNYVLQASKIIDFKSPNVEILYNGDWLNKLTLSQMLELLGKTTYQQLFERDMFQERIKNGKSISMREAIYPLLQGYDSVAMNVDLELGGTDQMFNMMMGRQLVKEMLHKEKFVMTTPLLTDSKGVKIGKSEGNVIALTDTPNDLYGKIMSLGDDVIIKGFEYLTDVSMNDIKEMESSMKDGSKNPIEYKKQLAHAVVMQLNTKEDADRAQRFFENTFQKHATIQSGSIPVFKREKKYESVIDLMVEAGLAQSKSQARRLLQDNAVEFNGKKVVNTEDSSVLKSKQGILKVGKNHFVEIT